MGIQNTTFSTFCTFLSSAPFNLSNCSLVPKLPKSSSFGPTNRNPTASTTTNASAPSVCPHSDPLSNPTSSVTLRVAEDTEDTDFLAAREAESTDRLAEVKSTLRQMLVAPPFCFSHAWNPLLKSYLLAFFIPCCCCWSQLLVGFHCSSNHRTVVRRRGNFLLGMEERMCVVSSLFWSDVDGMAVAEWEQLVK